MAWPKGKPRPKGAGRKRGTPNKATADVKEAILEAFGRLGGPDYLEKIGKSHPHVYCTLLGKIVPTEVKAELTGAGGGPLLVEMIVEHHAATAAIDAPAGGSGERQAHPAISPRPDAGVAVNGAVHSRSGGHT